MRLSGDGVWARFVPLEGQTVQNRLEALAGGRTGDCSALL